MSMIPMRTKQQKQEKKEYEEKLNKDDDFRKYKKRIKNKLRRLER